MIKWYFTLIILVFFVFLGTSVHAATGVPSVLSFQGRLTNSSGDLLTGTYYFKFSIWDVATNGTAGTNRLWPSGGPTSLTAKVTQGVFNVNIGDTANGYPDELNYNFNTNNAIYLQVEASSTNSGFEALSPRQRISAAAFARLAGAVSGVGQSSFGTTTPISGAIVTISSSSASFIPLFIKAAASQVANLFKITDSSLNSLLTVDSSGGLFASQSFSVGQVTSFIVNHFGKVGVGTSNPTRKFNILEPVSTPQFRLGQDDSVYSEFYTDSSGDVRISTTGGNVRQNNENMWVCSGDGCNTSTPSTKGNIIMENTLIFDNSFQFRQSAASVSMYDSSGNQVLQFDTGQ